MKIKINKKIRKKVLKKEKVKRIVKYYTVCFKLGMSSDGELRYSFSFRKDYLIKNCFNRSNNNC